MKRKEHVFQNAAGKPIFEQARTATKYEKAVSDNAAEAKLRNAKTEKLRAARLAKEEADRNEDK